jgi:hypothetical protein
MVIGEPSPKREKVFCKECKYIKHKSSGGHNVWAESDTYVCLHPKNRAPKNDTWLKPDKSGEKSPKVLNKKNNCLWYHDKKVTGSGDLWG